MQKGETKQSFFLLKRTNISLTRTTIFTDIYIYICIMVVCSSKQTCLFPQRLIGQFPRRWQIFDRNVRVIDLCRFVEWKVQSLKRIFHGERTPEELIYSIILSIRSIFFKLTTRSIQKYQYKNRFKNFKSSFPVKLFGIIDRSLIEKKNLNN